jgi:hypothetical protein
VRAALPEALLGLAGFRALEVTEQLPEPVVEVEVIAETESCAECGTPTVAHERRPTAIWDLPFSRLRSPPDGAQ